jgi:hypothetical protein
MKPTSTSLSSTNDNTAFCYRQPVAVRRLAFYFFTILSLLNFGVFTPAMGQDETLDIDAEAEKILTELLGDSDLVADSGLPSDPELAAVLQPVPPRKWDLDASLKAGAGYKENVLYSAYHPSDSLYSLAELDAFLMRRQTSSNQLYFYLFGQQRHFFDIDEAENEQSVVFEGNYLHQFTPTTGLELAGNYFYVDQFFDASISEVESDEFRLVQHDLSLRSAVQQSLGKNWKLWIGGGGGEVMLEDSQDDYTQWNMLGRLEYAPRRYARYGLIYRREYELYSDRIQRTAIGETIPGETVDLTTDSLRLYGFHPIDRQGKLHLFANLTGYLRDDNGGGYYDYDRWRASLGLRGRHNRWKGDLAISYTDTQYTDRPSVFMEPDSPRLARDRVSVWAAVEYQFSDHWFAFVEGEWEDNDSNDPIDVYSVTSAALGLGFRL